MKRILLFSLTMLLLAFFVRCNKSEEFSGAPEKKQSEKFRFYGVVNNPTTKGLAQRDKLWNSGSHISVKFLNPETVDPCVIDHVKAIAKEWEAYANIYFDFVESGNALVRVGFDFYENTYLTWSYIGNDCKFEHDQSVPTMNFASLDCDDYDQLRADVLRAFGQVLGLELEHRHIEFVPNWKKEGAIINYWSDVDQIPWDELKQYVFDPLDNNATLAQTKEYDAQSIMVWPFPRNILANGNPSGNYELSEMDKKFIAELYPGKQNSAIFSMEYQTDPWTNSLSFHLTNTQSVTILWGDHQEKLVPPSTNALVTLSCGENETGILKIIGSRDALTNLSFDYYHRIVKVKSLNLKDNKQLKVFIMANDYYGIETIDVSGCDKLETLVVYRSSLTSLDVSRNINLQELNISYSKLTSLDVSKNINLNRLVIYSSPLTSLDVSKNINLQLLNIYGLPLSSNIDEILSTVNGLVDRNGRDGGMFHIDNDNLDANIKSLVEQKNWSIRY